ncbi:MAG: glucose-1-phosphate adenylyltransferase [Candidatus Promineifilaceae bacterium]
MSNVLGLVLGGGRGSRLYPLTSERSKPAVPLAAKYRLIDIPMSNCFHAGIEKIAILTQFNSASLHRHIYRTYARDMFSKGWVQILAAEQTPRSGDWYQGTADAVRKQLVELKAAQSEYTLILSGDHLYRMDYRAFAQFHADSGADVSIAVQPVTRQDATGFGILKLDEHKQIVEFHEKPQDPKLLDSLVSSTDPLKPYMASMGIYIFRTSVLIDMLNMDGDDFGKEIIPAAINTHRVMGYQYDGYWADIGTIRSFFDVNIGLTSIDPVFDFYDAQRPIYTRPRFLPGSAVHGGSLNNVLLADGCRSYNATVRDSVIGIRSVLDHEATLNNVVMLGADIYEQPSDIEANKRNGIPNVGIGAGSMINTAIIDKDARIGRNVVIRHMPDRPDEQHATWTSRGGIVVIPKNAIIPDGTVL